MAFKRITALLLGLLLLFSLTGCSAGDYKKAVSLTETGDWQGAREIFVSLEDYKDSAEKLRECDYHIALEKMAAGEYDVALEILLSLGEYSAAAAQADECRYLKASSLLEKGRWDDASEIFEALGSYRDSAEMISECSYRKAAALLKDRDFDQAAEIFSNLGDYRDSGDKYKSCMYQKAMQLYENGEFEAAYPIFMDLADYEDSDYHSVLSLLQYDQQAFVDTFAQVLDQLFKAGNTSLSMKESKVSYQRDARDFMIDSNSRGRDVSISFEPSNSDGSVTSRGQISAISIMGDTRSASDIETTLSETMIAAVLAMTVLDDAASPEEFAVVLGEAYAKMLLEFPDKIPEEGHFERMEIPYEHYKCRASISAWPNYYRFLYVITIPELVKQK